jgi:hypothetical protein
MLTSYNVVCVQMPQFLGRVYWQKKMDRFKESRDQITEEQTGAGARAIEKDRQLRARQKRYAQVHNFTSTEACSTHTHNTNFSFMCMFVHATYVCFYFT